MGSLGYEDGVVTQTMQCSIDTSLTRSSSALPLLSLNHVSYLYRSLAESVKFYIHVLGFVLIKRPSSFNFQGAWLFNYGIGIHLLECRNLERKKSKINPKDNHISFQCSDMKMVINKLEEMRIEYVTAEVEEGGIKVDQMFFHDPDGNMIEICNCDNLPILPLSPSPLKTLPKETATQLSFTSSNGSKSELHCSNEVESQKNGSLVTDVIKFAF